MQKLTILLVQNSAGADVGANLAKIEATVAKAPAAGIVALPEVFALRGGDQDYRKAAEEIPGKLTERVAGWARQRDAWVLAGSILEKDGRDIFNTSVVFNRRGEIAAKYRKIHLFEAVLESGQVIREANVFTGGREPVLVDIEEWQCGLSVCYDLRFPELYRHYAGHGAHVLFIPSNFTQRTGKDHWDILVRARAIENQCFVVAPGQCGSNPVTGIASYGHSMAVGPWGEVLAELSDKEGVAVVELDPALLQQTRKRVPALKHRRLDGGRCEK